MHMYIYIVYICVYVHACMRGNSLPVRVQTVLKGGSAVVALEIIVNKVLHLCRFSFHLNNLREDGVVVDEVVLVDIDVRKRFHHRLGLFLYVHSNQCVQFNFSVRVRVCEHVHVYMIESLYV